jgi:glycosyltransferase involved in cell wall biosynthesis
MLLSVSFPAWNEEENIGLLLDEALEALPLMADDFEIVVVNDGSTDTTADIVADYAAAHTQVRLISHETNLGYGHALRSGLEHAKGDAIAIIDGDRQFKVADLSALLKLLPDNDVVIGYRIKRMDPPHRLFIAGVYHRVLKAAFQLHVRDVDCGMKLYRREVVDTLLPSLESRAAFISPELVIRSRHAGYRIAEAGVPHYPRVAGESKGATPKVVARTIGEILKLRRSLRVP